MRLIISSECESSWVGAIRFLPVAKSGSSPPCIAHVGKSRGIEVHNECGRSRDCRMRFGSYHVAEINPRVNLSSRLDMKMTDREMNRNSGHRSESLPSPHLYIGIV